MKQTLEINDRNDALLAFNLLARQLGINLQRPPAQPEQLTGPQEKKPEHRVTDGDVFRAPVESVNKLIENAVGGATAPAPTEPAPEPAKKPRQKRSDAGQPRGAYKNTDGTQASGPATANAGEPAGNVAGSSPAAVANQPAAAAPAAAQAQEAQRPEQQASPAADPNAKLTVEDARAALGRLNQTAGLGMSACMQHLQDFGVKRVSELPEKMIAVFIKQADEKIAEHVEAAA